MANASIKYCQQISHAAFVSTKNPQKKEKLKVKEVPNLLTRLIISFPKKKKLMAVSQTVVLSVSAKFATGSTTVSLNGARTRLLCNVFVVKLQYNGRINQITLENVASAEKSH